MHEYIIPLVELYRRNRNESEAEPMTRYMKNLFPFLGIKTPLRRELLSEYIKTKGLPSIAEVPAIVRQLWNLPEREYQYSAISLLLKFRKKLPAETINLYEELLVTKSWWDTVDGIAGWLVGEHFQRYPELRDQYIEKWMQSGNLWLQRTCLLFQLNYKSITDVDLLLRLIRELNGSREFFINKAIGWVLREYSKTDAELVIDFVENNRLSPLSRREALKWLINKGLYERK